MTTAPQLDLLEVPPEYDIERLRAHNTDRTPRPVAGQGLEWLLSFVQLPPNPVVIECAAGEGSIVAEVKRLLPNSHRVAIEPRAECEKYLRRHADEIIIDYFVHADPEIQGCRCPKAHLVVSNPAFSDAYGKPLWMNFWARAQDLLLPGGVVMFLGLNEIGQRGQAQHAQWITSLPTRQARIGGPIGFRGAQASADLRSYSWWARDGEPNETGWLACDLPWLPTESRQWRKIPGTEVE